MNAMAAVARLLDIGARRPWRVRFTGDETGTAAPSVSLPAMVFQTPARPALRCPHCGRLAR